MTAARFAILPLLLLGCPAQKSDDLPDLSLPDLAAPPYEVSVLDRAQIVSQGGAPNFHRARATLTLPGPAAKVVLVADLESPCFPFAKWKTEPPPTGQNWPASCDAFDRNFEFTLDEPAAMTDPPALELVRAITPFGGPLHIEEDITDVANGLPGRHELTVTIPTYSDGAGKVSGSAGSWFVSARLRITPGPAPRKVLAVRPLFNLSHGATTAAQDYTITVPAGTVSSRLEYRATGHGGDSTADTACIGPAEEFCRRAHTVLVDGQQVQQFTPWRNDCTKGCTKAMEQNPFGAAYYCAENPCGLPASVNAPRANWCPGSLTPPRTWDVDALHAPGAHTLRYTIAKVAQGGVWRLSATYFAFAD